MVTRFRPRIREENKCASDEDFRWKGVQEQGRFCSPKMEIGELGAIALSLRPRNAILQNIHPNAKFSRMGVRIRCQKVPMARAKLTGEVSLLRK